MLSHTFRTLLAAVCLSAGCGFSAGAESAAAAVDVELPFGAASVAPPATSLDASLATFTIDVGAGVGLDENTYAITTNGADWSVTWRGDRYFRRFQGEVLNGTRFSGLAKAGLFAGDVVRQTAPNRVVFDTHTDGRNIQSFTVRSSSEPVRFNLWIEGSPATFAVIFPSGGVESTSDEMPFDLVTGDFAGVRAAPRVAPERARIEHATASATDAGNPNAQRPFIAAPTTK